MSTTDLFQELVDILKQALTPAPTSAFSTSSVSDASSSAPSPVARPAPYAGSAEECNGFLLQCTLSFEMQPHLFPTERSKIGFIITHLQGKALRWAETIWDQGGTVTQTAQSFIQHFKEVFGKPPYDSSISDQLFLLRQSNLPIKEYALQFRTLAAASGWNERALLSAYRQGLEPHLRLQMAAYDDSLGLENFIQHSIRCAARMQHCLPELVTETRQSPFTPRFADPRLQETTPEPMQLDQSRLSAQERARRFNLGLCMYCGEKGHLRSNCPVRPPRLVVSAVDTDVPNLKPLTTEVYLTSPKCSFPVTALLDTGSAGNFISASLCRLLGLPTTATPRTYQVQSITGTPVSRRCVSRWSVPVQIRLGALHVEDIRLLVLEGSPVDIILGRPWFILHNPIISWQTGELLKWGSTCHSHCFPELPKPHPKSEAMLKVNVTSIESHPEKQSIDIPTCYKAFSDVFCPQKAKKPTTTTQTLGLRPRSHPG